jgi:hypothetical protein
MCTRFSGHFTGIYCRKTIFNRLNVMLGNRRFTRADYLLNDYFMQALVLIQ